jgi:hypothetical protein
MVVSPIREPIKIHPAVRDELRDFLIYEMEGTGVGYTAVVKAAVDLARSDEGFRQRMIAAQFSVSTLDNATFTCPDCRMTSHNPNDVENRYCGHCHQFKT